MLSKKSLNTFMFLEGFDKKIQCAVKMENKIKHVRTQEEEDIIEQLLSIKIKKKKKKQSKYTSRKKVKMQFLSKM